jgi:hypothetical protein
MCPGYRNPDFRGREYSSKLQFAVWHVPLEDLFYIRKYNRDQGTHILVKQRLEGVSSDPFAFSGFCGMVAATRFSMATVCFFSFWPSLNSLKVFFTIWPLSYFKTNLFDAPKQSSKFRDC